MFVGDCTYFNEITQICSFVQLIIQVISFIFRLMTRIFLLQNNNKICRYEVAVLIKLLVFLCFFNKIIIFFFFENMQKRYKFKESKDYFNFMCFTLRKTGRFLSSQLVYKHIVIDIYLLCEVYIKTCINFMYIVINHLYISRWTISY